MSAGGRGGFQFPRWTNWLRPALVVVLLTVPPYLGLLVWLGGSPRTTDVGYQPEQPVPYSHALHVGQLGLDCRYCHNTIETAAFAAIPPSATCLNCHE
ncbi:MAG TPA: cytochrome c3 family protein, partial [Thermoanaerobaculaceae bacterium]|nr:cytochrome c3 family protein [Thermoanaerobaculaceae bacterium]